VGGVNELTPYICVADARAAVEWYVDVLGAEVTHAPIEMPDGRIGHVELAVGDARWMMSDEFAEANVAAPDPARGNAVSLHLTVDDVDTLADRAESAGATLDRGPENSEPAGRVAVFRDPFGHRWFLNRPQQNHDGN
jgi:PhnB protein